MPSQQMWWDAELAIVLVVRRRRQAWTAAIVVNALLGLLGLAPMLTWAWVLDWYTGEREYIEGSVWTWLVVNVVYLVGVAFLNWIVALRMELHKHRLVTVYARVGVSVLVIVWAAMAMQVFTAIRPPFLPDSLGTG